MRKLVLLAVLAIVVLPVPAQATEVTQFTWDRTGAEHLPCAGSVQWLLSPGDGIDTATVGINDDDGEADGHSWGMLKDWETNEWYVTTTEPVSPTDEVLGVFIGVGSPSLTLVDCAPGEAAPIPTTNPEPTPPTESSPPPALVTWNISFMVTTPVRTNVVVRSRVTCSNATDEVIVKRRLQAKTPIVKHLPASLEGATSCRIRVVAFDIKPWHGPHGDGQHPTVTTWVTHT
jgi:hypothetical protein